MSRCFPFPPPGYEKKPTTDEADLLKKEKHKEKKHKKDKKDKEKKEGKEKREKDRSDGKNREKKDRKEKHREKKKDKDKDKDKSSISEEKRVGGQLEGYNGEKVHPKEELDKEKKSRSDEKKAAIQSFEQQGEKPVQSSILVKETEDPKFVQELGRRIRDDEKGAGSSQLVERFNVLERKKDDPAGRSAVGDIGMVSEGKNKDKETDNRKMDGQRIRDESSFGGSTVVENRAGMAQSKLEGPTLLSDKKTDKKIEEKNKSRDRANDDKRGDKRKKKDGEKKSREKEKKKEEKAKEKSEHKRTEKSKTKHSSKGGIVSAPNDKSTHLPKDGAGTAASEGNLKKRKAVETNGFSHDDEPRPNKMPRPASNVSTQNGRKLEPSQSPGLFPLDRQRQMASPNNLKVDNKEQKINGVIAAPPLSVPKPKPSSLTASHNVKPFPVSVNKPSSSTVVSVSTAKPSSATANELSAPVTSVSILKPPNVTANEIAAPFMSVSARPPPSASPNETATSVTSIVATKQPSPVLPNDIAPKKASVSSRKPSSATNNQVVKASMKPPHPDSKFLSQILTVPKLEEVPDLDDQEWLFSSKDRLLKKPDMASVGVPEEPQVWAEALRLESVDIFALPYVVPY